MIGTKTNTNRVKVIRNFIDENGIKIYFLAKEIDVTSEYLSMILTGQKPVSDVVFSKIKNYFQNK